MEKEELKAIKKEARNEQAQNEQKEKQKTGNKYLGTLKKYATKRNMIIAGIIMALVIVSMVLRKTVFKPAPKSLYQVAVMVRSQSNKDPVEDRKTSLKKGDVLSIQDIEHKWSKTESISYLIFKMELRSPIYYL